MPIKMDLKKRHYIDLVSVLTQKEIKVRYKSSFLGYVWSVAHPLAFALVYFVAFKIVLKIGIKDYALFLIAGLFPWQWFGNSVTASTMVFIGNASIIKKVNFKKNVIPLALVMNDMIHFALSVPVIILFLLIYHKSPALTWIAGLPAMLCIQFAITYGFALIMSSVNLFFRDMEKLVTIFLTLVFYFTPVVYDVRLVPEKYRYLLDLNPLAPLIISWRDLLVNGVIDVKYMSLAALYAAVFLAAGHAVYRKLSWRFAEVL